MKKDQQGKEHETDTDHMSLLAFLPDATNAVTTIPSQIHSQN